MPTLTGDRQSIFTDTARDQKRENQRESFVEGLLGSNPIRRNDSAQSSVTTKPSAKAASPPQKSSGWGSWGSSLLTNTASAADHDRTLSREPAPVKPKIEDPPRGFTPSQPPKSQPAGLGSLNEPAWVTGSGDTTTAWGVAKPGPTPITQKTSTGPFWGAKPAGSTFGSGGTGWGTGTGPVFGSGAGKKLSVDTAMKPVESGSNIAGPENIPESAIEIRHVPAPKGFSSAITDKEEVESTRDDGWGGWEVPESAIEIKHVPAPGRFSSAITDKKEVESTQDDGWGRREEATGSGNFKSSKGPSPVQEQVPEPRTEVIRELVRVEETGKRAEEFDWANTTKENGGQVASVAQTPPVPNVFDNADDGPGGGAGGGKKNRKKGKR